jgi:hypothetical protein
LLDGIGYSAGIGQKFPYSTVVGTGDDFSAAHGAQTGQQAAAARRLFILSVFLLAQKWFVSKAMPCAQTT